MLVDAHAPEAGHFLVGVAVKRGQVADVLSGYARDRFHLLRCVIFQERFEAFEVEGRRFIVEGKAILQPVTDIGQTRLEGGVLADEGLMHPAIADDLVADGIRHRQIGLRLEDDRMVRRQTGAGGACGQVNDPHIGTFDPLVQHS